MSTEQQFQSILERCGYESITSKGRGSYGHVFSVRDPKQNNKQYALKICCEPVSASRSDQDRSPLELLFRQEFLIQNKYHSHPHLLRVDKFENYRYLDQSYFWYTMELCDCTVVEGIKNYSFQLSDRVDMVWQFIDGLLFLHSMGVIHRDIKPNNLLLVNGQHPHIKIADFGSARVHSFESDGRMIEERAYQVGTRVYMAPELLQPDGAIINNEGWMRADQFSAGVTIFEILSGDRQVPYPKIREINKSNSTPQAKCDAALAYYQQAQPEPLQLHPRDSAAIPAPPPKPVSSKPADFAPGSRDNPGARTSRLERHDLHYRKLNAVIAKMVAVDPRERFESIRDCMRELSLELVNEGLHPRGANQMKRLVSTDGGVPEVSSKIGLGEVGPSPLPRSAPGTGLARANSAGVMIAIHREKAAKFFPMTASPKKHVWSIGSDPGCDLCLEGDTLIAAKEAEIVFSMEGDGFRLRYCDPKARDVATAVTEKPLNIPDKPDLPLQDGMRIRCGSWCLIVRI